MAQSRHSGTALPVCPFLFVRSDGLNRSTLKANSYNPARSVASKRVWDLIRLASSNKGGPVSRGAIVMTTKPKNNGGYFNYFAGEYSRADTYATLERERVDTQLRYEVNMNEVKLSSHKSGIHTSCFSNALVCLILVAV
jgi:hypothetical protein